LDERVASVKERPGVFFQIGVSPIVSAGSRTFIHELILRAGGRNLAAGETVYPRFSEEQVLALEPEVIVVTTMAGGGVSEEALERWKRWTHLPAVERGRLVLVDSDLFDRPGLRLVDALELLVRAIHPGLMP
jgi:iron complex transport system substrate-binding protein